MTNTAVVGVDISTMEAIQSLGASTSDPWALDCFSNWVDVLVNHADVRFALPKAIDDLDTKITFPSILQQAQSAGLMRPVDDTEAADRIALSEDDVTRLYIIFEAWAEANVNVLKAWLAFTTGVRRINAGRFIDEGELNLWVRDHFWPKRPKGWLRAGGHGISGDQQQLAFDMVVRAAQYHIAFRDGAYQPHPLRSLYVTAPQKPTAVFSWGWLLAATIARGAKAWDRARLLATLQKLRAELQNGQATSSHLLQDTPDARRQKLNSIAVAMGVHILPPTVEKWIDRTAVAIGVPIEIAGDMHHIPLLGVAWEIVQVPVKKGVASAIQRLKFVQRRVDPEKLTARPHVDDVRRHLRL